MLAYIEFGDLNQSLQTAKLEAQPNVATTYTVDNENLNT